MRTFATFVSLVMATAHVPPMGSQAPRSPERELPAGLERHRMHVTLEGGMAVVAEELTLHSDAPRRDEERLVLRVPIGAELVALEACQAGRCRRGTHVRSAGHVYRTARYAGRRSGTPPLVLASRDGDALTLDVAGLESGDAQIRVAWSAPTERLDGVERLRMPARETEAELTLVSASLEQLSLEDDAAPTRTPIGRDYDLVGRSRPGAPTIEVVQADESGAGWVRLAPPARRPTPTDVALLVDVSPSTRDHATAIAETLRLALEALPDGSTATVIAFARRARVVAHGEVATLRGATPLLPEDLGPSTSIRAALTLLDDQEGPAPSAIVWIGDGGLSWGAEERAAADTVRRRGGTNVVVGDERRASGAMHVSPLTDAARVRDRLASLFVPTTELRVGDRSFFVRAGASLLLVEPDVRAIGAPRANVPDIAARPYVRARLGQSRPRELLTLDPRDRHAAHKTVRGQLGVFVGGGAIDYGARPYVPRIHACVCEIRGAMSREAIRRTIDHLRPAVSACFEDARHGDPHYAARATLVLGLEDDELAHADVETDDPALRPCILDALDDLVAPTLPTRDRERTIVRYPFVTEAWPVAAPMPLQPTTAASVDALFGAEPAIPPRSLIPELDDPAVPSVGLGPLP